MVGYGGEILRWVGEKLSAFGDWCKDALYKMTHDPLWMGVSIGVIVLLILLFILKRRVS
jgi:hypothetical protein